MNALSASASVVLFRLLLLTRSAISDVTIKLSPTVNSSNVTLNEYRDSTPFRQQYANVPPNFQGYIHQPRPSNGCDYITPLPGSVANHSWIALVDGYSDCTEAMIDNVRNAGYDLIVAYSSENRRMSVDNYIRNTGFGVVVISQTFALTLYYNRITDLNQSIPEGAIQATVAGYALSTPLVITSLFCVTLFFCCCIVCCCCYCRRRSNQQYIGLVDEIEGRRRNFERVQRQERLARQELIESILRQLQELQVDLRSQVPLGENDTALLPTRKFRRGEEKIERCAICVEDFQDGDSLRVLPCEHYFHRQCVDEWLINHSAVCPLCKYEVPRSVPGQGERGRGADVRRREREEGRRPLLTDNEDSSPTLLGVRPLVIPPRSNAGGNSQTRVRQHYGSV